jgi:putative transposase
MSKKRWSKEEKLQILQEAKAEGVQVTLRKYGVYPATYYSWRKKYLIEGEEGISDTASRRKDKHYIRQLEDEVSLLKQLLAEKELSIALHSELLKKKYPWARRKT